MFNTNKYINLFVILLLDAQSIMMEILVKTGNFSSMLALCHVSQSPFDELYALGPGTEKASWNVSRVRYPLWIILLHR